MTKVPTRFPSKELRERHRLLTSLGYRIARMSGSHWVYKHPVQEALTVATTPGDWRGVANELAEIKRRHPEAFTVGKSQRRSRKRRRVGARLPDVVEASVFELTRWIEEAARPYSENEPSVSTLGCVECGRPWLSDLDPTYRRCPECGGVIGREAA